MGKSTISMAIFNSYVTNYQRVEVVQFYGDRMKMTKYIHHEIMIIDVGLDYHEKMGIWLVGDFNMFKDVVSFIIPPKGKHPHCFHFFLERTHFSTTHVMSSSKDLVTQNPIVYHCSILFIIVYHRFSDWHCKPMPHIRVLQPASRMLST